VRRAEDGSEDVVRVLDEAGRWLGVALASTFNLLDLRAVVLGGCFGPLAPWLADEVRRTLEERSLAARSGSFVVVPSAFGDGAAVRGAAALPLRRALEEPWEVSAVDARSKESSAASMPGRAGRGKEVAIGHA
jgi:predicted NBD/HSP70 family sugar kinase